MVSLLATGDGTFSGVVCTQEHAQAAAHAITLPFGHVRYSIILMADAEALGGCSRPLAIGCGFPGDYPLRRGPMGT